MSRPLVLAAFLSASMGCLGYRNNASSTSRPTQPQQQQQGYGAPVGYGTPAPNGQPGGVPQQQPPAPVDPVTMMVGSAWTLFGMMTQGMPAPAPQSAPPPTSQAPPMAWPFPFPIPTMTTPAPVPSSPGPPVPVPPVSSGDAPADWARFEDEVLALTNQRRAQGATCGTQSYPPAPPLAANLQLRQAARAHAKDMGTRDYFDHKSPEGRTPVDRAHAAGFTSSFVGENIAAGYHGAESVVAGWMKSTGHCTNIMDARYTLLGVGYASVAKSSMTEYWVQNFGAAR